MKIFLLVLLGVVIVIALFGLELKSQVGRYQKYWHKRSEEPRAKNDLLYVALGDSTAQGIGASSASKGYVGLIAKELEKKHGQQVRVVNLSKYGDKIVDALDRQIPLLEKINTNSDTVVTIEIGANDMGSFESQKFEKQMDELMNKLPRQTVISDIPYFGGGLRRDLEPNVLQANKIIYRLAAKHNLKVAQLHAKIKDDNLLLNYAVDRFHPSSYGYKTRWVPAFLEQMK